MVAIFKAAPAPVVGWGEKFSATEEVLKNGRKWSNGNVAQQVGTHVVTPIAVAASTAIDALVHALLTVGKATGTVVNTVLYVGSGFNIGYNASFTPSQVISHAWKTAMSVAFLVVGLPISIFSAGTALNLATQLGLAQDIVKSGWEKFKDGIPSGSVLEKAKYVGKEFFTAAKDGVKSSATWAWDNVRYYAWDKYANHRIAQIAVVTSTILAYAGAAYYLHKAGAGYQAAFTAPVTAGVEQVKLGYSKLASYWPFGGQPAPQPLTPEQIKAAEEAAKKAACEEHNAGLSWYQKVPYISDLTKVC